MQAKDHAAWRQELALSLTLNTNQAYTKKQPPDPTILTYYSHPIVSSEDKIRRFQPRWTRPHVPEMAKLCKELFNWDSKYGMRRFMRSFVPGYLVWLMVHEGDWFEDDDTGGGDDDGIRRSRRRRKGALKQRNRAKGRRTRRE